MNLAHLSNAFSLTALAVHLGQSTAFAFLAWLLTLALRSYPARVRFSVWMAASVKFLVPLALLTSLGAHWAKPVTQLQSRRVFYTVIEEIGQPFASGQVPSSPHSVLSQAAHPSLWLFVLFAIWLLGAVVMLGRWVSQWRSARHILKSASPLFDGREVALLRRAESDGHTSKSIPIFLTSRAIEPGIFGVFRPVLLWPAGLSERLDDEQIRAIVAHEIEHVQRHDNLFAAVHALVEALFWFHLALRWMRIKLNEERERACDETVIERCIEAERYAQSILNVCAFCLESPLPCVSGVSGSDLKTRVLRIMTYRSRATLTVGRRIMLGALAVSVFTLPIGFGVVRGQAAPGSGAGSGDSKAAPGALAFDVASIKPATPSSDGRSMLMFTPDGTSIHSLPLQFVLRQAFGVEDDRILGAPSWVRSNRYDIEAKVTAEDAPRLEELRGEERNQMLIPLLAERFNLKYHHETRELTQYALVVAKGGPKLAVAKPASPSDDVESPLGGAPPKGSDTRGRMMMAPGRVESEGTTLDMLAHSLSAQLGRSVVDKTGLTGKYDYKLQWSPDNAPPHMAGPQGDHLIPRETATHPICPSSPQSRSSSD